MTRIGIATVAAVAILILSPVAFGLDPSKSLYQYSHAAWRLQDGSFSGNPNAIAQTPDGYIWIATVTGVYRFDGVRFTHFEDSPAGVNAMIVDDNGDLWLGGNGLYHFKRGKFTRIPGVTGRINEMAKDSHGMIWFVRSRIGSQNTPLCKLEGQTATCIGASGTIQFPYAVSLAIDSTGTFWMATSVGVVRWRKGVFKLFVCKPLLAAQNLRGVTSITPLPDGSVLVGAARSEPHLGLQRLVDGKWTRFVVPGDQSSALLVVAMMRDREGAVWVGTLGDGIYRIFHDEIQHFDRRDGLSGDTALSFFEDVEGNLWVSTLDGLDCIQDKRVITYGKIDGLMNDMAPSVLATRDGTVFIGSVGFLGSIHGHNVTSIPIDHRYGQQVTSLMEDRKGRLWVGIDNGLYIRDRNRFVPVRGEKEQLGTVTNLVEDGWGDVWAIVIGAASSALVHIKDDSIIETIELPANSTSLASDLAGGIYVCFVDRSCVRRAGDRILYKMPNVGIVGAIEPESAGSAWFASSTIIYWTGESVRSLSTRNGLPCDGSYALRRDHSGNLWSYSPCGIIEVSAQEIRRWKADASTKVRTRLFDATDGATPGAAAFSPRSAVASDGKIWFANDNHVQVVDPAENVESVAIPVYVENLIADHREIPITASMHLPARSRELELDYTGLAFKAPQNIKFRYRLVGYENNWQNAGTRRQAFFNDLRPGSYTFEVSASQDGQDWNGPVAGLRFVIQPAWYQTRWFAFLALVSVTALAWGFYRYRLMLVSNAMQERFQERLSERMRLARDLHDTLLQTIQGTKFVADAALDGPAEVQQLRRALQKLSAWLSEAIREGRAALSSLHISTIETNNLAVAFQAAIDECRMRRPVKAHALMLGSPRDLHPVMRDEVYLIGYEAIRNAFLHAGASLIEVTVTYSDCELLVAISDDGKGIDPKVIENGKKNHFGLTVMRSRAARVGATFSITSNPKGTTIRVSVPGRLIFAPKSKSVAS